jgi:uncharacterized protein
MLKHPHKRWQTKKIQQSLLTRRIVLLVGPRQCGKTTLSRTLATDMTAIYHTLDDLNLVHAAKSDPKEFIAHGDNLMIIDEIQRIPDLLLAIKQDVDLNPAFGRFLLTGSTNIQSMPGVMESLAGRIRKCRLRPLAMGELCARAPQVVSDMFSEKWRPIGDLYTKKQYIELAINGGYPEALLLADSRDKQGWYRDYIQALIDRDLKDILNIKRQDSLQKLLPILAAWSSKLMDVHAIGAGLGLSRATLESYINAIEALFLVERLPAWNKTDYDRVGKQDKLFVTDTGLQAMLLKWTPDEVYTDGDKNGKLLETFVFTQLAPLLDAQAANYQLYHYRDREKREIDFLIENDAGHYVGIEVKATSVVTQEHFKHLKWFGQHMAKDTPFVGIVLYTGEHVLSFGDKLWALPISSLWS